MFFLLFFNFIFLDRKDIKVISLKFYIRQDLRFKESFLANLTQKGFEHLVPTSANRMCASFTPHTTILGDQVMRA